MSGIGRFVDYFIDDDPAKIGRFPPVAEGRPCIISTLQFEATACAGTVFETGFGYPRGRYASTSTRRGTAYAYWILAISLSLALEAGPGGSEGDVDMKEPQYQSVAGLKPSPSLTGLGMMNSKVRQDDARCPVFTLASYAQPAD